MGVFSEDPSMMLRNVSKNRQNSINQFGGQYQPNQYLDYTDQMTNNGTMRDTPRIVDINQWQNQINQQGVSGIPDALSWNTYGSPSNPENQFFRKQYQKAQEIKWDVQNSYNRTPEEAEAQKNLFWLASKYNLRIDPFKKDSDDEEIYDDSFRANFGDDKEGHYSAFKNLAQKYPEMAKKITKYQNYQAQANDRKAMEYDRRFGTQYYKRTSVEKSKPFSIEEWSRKAKEDIIKTNPDGTLRIDTGLAQKYMVEAHQMRLDQMDWGQTVINKIGRFAGGLLDFANPSTWLQNTDYGFDNEMYAKHKVEKETGGIGSLRWGDIIRDAPSNIVEAARSVSALIMSTPSLFGATGTSKWLRDNLLAGNYDKSEIIQSDINAFAEILRAGKENPVFDMKDIQGINHGTYDFLNSVGPTSGVLGTGALVAKVSSGGVGFIASMLAGEIAPSLWSGVQETIFGKEAHRYNQLASFMESIYPDHESIDNYDKITAGITDRNKRAEREAISKQLRAMRENVIGDIKGDNSYLTSTVPEFWNRYGGMAGDVLMLGFAMNQGRNMFKVKGLSPSPENMAKFPKLNFADNFYANLYNNMYIRGGDKGYIRNIVEKSIGFIGSVGTEFKATDLKSINGKMDKFFEVAKRIGNYSVREALDAIPTWAVAEMLKHNGDLSTKQLTTAMETGMAYNVLGMAMAKGFQAVGKRAKFQDMMNKMKGTLPDWIQNKLPVGREQTLKNFSEFKDHPFLKQFGEQYDVITYKSRVLGDWFANPVQGLFSAAVIEDGNWVDNADRYLRNEALGDLVTGALLSAHMAYGSKNARKNYAQIYDNIVAQERQKEMNANFEKQTKDFIEPDPEPEEEPQSEQSTPSTEPTSAEPPAPETEGKPDSAPIDLKDAMDYLHEIDDAEKLSEISSVDKSSDDETEAKLELLSNTEQLNNQVNEEEVPFDQNNATSDETVNPDTVHDPEYDNQDTGEGLIEVENADVNELKNTPMELGKDDSIAPPALGETEAKHQGIFVPKNQGIELTKNPLQLRTSIEGVEYDVENINGQLMYKDQSGSKPLPKDAPTYSTIVNNEEAVKVWVQDFGERVRDVWLKNIEENTGGHNKFLANAEVMLKTSLIKNYGVNPFIANLVNNEGMTSGKIKSLIGINSNINAVHDNMLKQKDQGKVLDAYESQQLALNHEMFHLMEQVFKDDPEYQRLKVQALEALKIIQEDDEDATKRYDINYRNYYEGEIRKLGKDISDPKIQERIQGFIDEERLSDMWGAFVVGNDKFKEETGLIGKWFKVINERFVEKSGGYRGLLNLWRIGKKLELFDFITKQDVNANLDRWMSNKQATKRLDPAMASLAEKHAMTSNLVGLNIESKQIVSKLKELDNNLAHTSDVVDKFRGDWKDFNKYYDFLESRFLKQGKNKIFNDKYDVLDFATKSYIKMHPNSYEENNSSSMFIFSHDGQRIDVRIAPYNGKAVATSSIPTKAYGNTQLGESHNVEKYRLKKSGWQKAQETFRIMLGKTANNKENSSVYYQDFLNDLSDGSAIVRHPDNVGVMMPVRDQNYNMLTPKNRMGKDGKGHSFVRDADGYYVSPDNRYTLKSDVDEHGNVTTNLVKDKNGELHFKQHYKFDSAIYNSNNSIDITRRLLQSGYYPMPGTHVAMQTIDIHRIMEKVFQNNLNYIPTKNSEANLNALQAYGKSIERIADYEHGQLKYFLESQYAQEEFGYFGKAIIPTNILNGNIPVIDLVNLVPDANGRLIVQINPEAKIKVEGNKISLGSSENKQQIMEFSKDAIEGMQKALDSISGSFAPISNYYMNNEFREPLFMKRDGSNIIEPIEDFYLNDIVSNPNDFIDRLYNQVEKINTIVNKDGMEIPRTRVDEIVHEAVKNVMLDKLLAVIDQQMLSAVDAGGKAFVLSGKYNHKYVSSLTHEWEAPNLRDLLPSLNKVRNYGKLMGMDGNLSDIAPQGLEVITDGNKEKQLALNAYIFDPDVWKAQYPEMTEHIDRLLAVLGKQAIDGATIMLNNDPYDLRPGMTIQEALGLIGGVNPTGSYKNRLHIGTTEGTLELKHAMHPLTYSDTRRVGELVPAGSEELGQLVALLRASGIGAIIMKSALKGDGTHSLRQKEIDGKIYGVGVFGDIRGEYDPTTDTFIPVKSIEGQDKVLNGIPTIPIKEMFKANESGLQLSDDNVALIRQRMIQIPLTGSQALSWGDGQKGKPHSVTGSAPFRFASFSKNSQYMQAPTGIDGFDAFEGNANNAITNWVQNMAQGVQDLHNAFGDMSDYVSGLKQSFTKDELANVHNLVSELRDYIKNRVDRERDLDNDDSDEFMKQSLNYSTDTTDYKNTLRLIDKVLEKSPEELHPSDLAPLFAMTDSVFENSFVTKLIAPEDSKTGVNTVFWQMMKFKHKNLVNLKGKGTMSVFVPNLDNRGDLARMTDLAEKIGMREQFEKMVLENDMYDAETGLWKDGSQAISVSDDIMKKFKLKPGDKIFAMLVPPDSAISTIPMRVMGLLHKDNQNAVAFNSKLALEFWGRDHDIDQVSIMVNDSNWKDKEGNDGYGFLWDTLTHHGFHQGKPKQNIVDAKKILDSNKKNAGWTIKKNVSVRGKKEPFTYDIPNFNKLSQLPQFMEDGIFDNVYESRGYPVLSNLEANAPHDSRAYFSNKKIALAASLSNKMGSLIHKYDGEIEMGLGRGLNINLVDYSTLKNALGDRGEDSMYNSISNLKFKVRHNDKRYDAHLPYVKEGTVDTYSQMPIEFQPYVWMATMLVDDISFNVDSKPNSEVTGAKFADIKDPVVRLYIAAQLRDLENKNFSGQFPKAAFDREGGYTYDNIRETMNKVSKMDEFNKHAFQSAIAHVLKADFGIEASDRMELQATNSGSLGVRNFNSIDDIILNTFKSLFYTNAKYGTDPMSLNDGEGFRASFMTKKEQFEKDRGFNSGVAKYKAKMIKNTTAALQTLFHFNMLHDRLLPDSLFKPLNPMPPLMKSPDGIAFEGKMTNNLGNAETKNHGSLYFNTIDRISKMAYGWLSAFDQEYARYQNENDPRDWSMPEVDAGKERQLFSMQELFRNLIVSDDFSPYTAIHNDLLTEAFLDPIMNTFLDAEMNDNNKTSMIYHQDKHGRYLYDRTNPIDIMFPGALHPNADKFTSAANWTDSVNIHLANPDGTTSARNIKARMFLDGKGEPMLNITHDGRHYEYDGNINIPVEMLRDTRKMITEIFDPIKGIDSAGAYRLCAELVQAMAIGGKAYSAGLRKEGTKKAYGSISLIGAIPNKASHKQNFLRLLYTNMIDSMGERALKNPAIAKDLIESSLGAKVDVTPQLIKNLVAGMVMGHPLGGESFNRYFGTQNGNKMTTDEFKPILGELNKLTQSVRNMYGNTQKGNLEFLNQTSIVTGKGATKNNNKITKLINDGGKTQYLAKDLTASRTPGDVLTYLNILEDVAMRYATQAGERPEMLNKIKNSLMGIKDLQDEIVKYMDPMQYNQLNENKTKWKHFEELFNGNAFMFTPLGQKVMQELDNRGTTPSVIYNSKENGIVHDIRDMASKLMVEYAKSESTGQGEQDILPKYSLFDDFVPTYESISKLNNKVPNYIKAMRIMDHIVGFFRRNSSVSSKFRDSVNTYMKDKKFSDGTPVTFEHLFDYSTMKGGLNMAADKIVRADEVSQLLKGYFYNELANIYNLSPAERKAQYELWNKADTSPEDAPNVKAKDYVARLAFEQLKAISRTSAIVLDKALNDFELDSMGRSNTTAFLNKHAENIAEMFHVLKDYKQYEKYKAKQMKSKAMTIEQANNSVEQAIKLNLNITQRNSPETLCKLFGRQKVLVRGSVVIMPTFDVDENGNLIEGKPTAVALNSDQTSPNMFLGVTSNSEQEVRVSDTGSIILSHADAIRDLVNRSERAKNDATAELLQSMGKVTLEQEEEYNSALKMINDVMPEYFSPDFRIRFAKISGRIVPMAEFKFNNETIHASHTAVGERLSDVQRKFVQEFRSRIKSKKEEGDIHDFTYLQKSPIAEKALQNWLLIKIVAAHQGIAAKQYISVLDNLLSKLDPLQMTSNGSLYDPYTKQFQLTRDELQQIVDLTLFADEQPHPDYPNVKVANKESFYYLPGSSINMNQMKLNVRTKIDQLMAQLDAENTQVYTDDKVSLERICRIFGTTLEKVKDNPKSLRKILESAKGYVTRQSNVDNEDEQYTMKDRMVGTVKRTGLTMNNRITMELLAMADTGERVYAGSVTPKSIDNLNQLMDKSFNMAAYGLLGKIYDHISTDMKQQLKPAYGIEVNGHIEENPLVTTEVYNQLAEMRGESVAYSEMLEKDDNGSYNLTNGDVVSVDYKVQKGNKFKFKSTKGLVIEESDKSILLWIPSKNTFERVPKVHISYAKRGLAYNDEYKAYLDTIQRTFKTLILPTESINQFLTNRDKGWKNKDYDVVNNMDANLQLESDNITDAIYKQDVPWKARMSRVRKYGIAAEALGGYQGGMKLIGGVVAGATSLGAFAIGNPIAGSALGGYAITQFMGYLGKQAGAIGQNYGSALMREMMPINGLFKTMKDALSQTVKETTSDTQSAITNAISTFMKDEVTQKQMISDMDRPQVNSLINLLSKANSVIDRDEKLGKAFRDFENGNIKEIHVRLAAQKALEDNMAPDDDYAKFWLDHIDFDYESRQYILQNGHEINSLMKLKHDLIKDRITNLLTFGQLIARSEETSKKLGSKVFAQYLDEEQIVTGANQNEVSTIIDRFMDRSAGNYKSNKRLSKNKHGFNQLLTLYERFNRDNNAYYLNDIYKAIDKSLSIDFLAQNFGGYGKTDRGTYNTVKGITTEDGEVLSVTTAYNIDELKAFKKKLAITASMAVTNMLSKAGMLLLAGYVTNEELAKKLKTMFSGVEAISGIERYTSIGGFLHASTNAALLAGTAMLYNHNEMLRGTTNKAALKSLIKDEIRNSGSILQSAGIGLGYSKIFELPMGLGNQFMLHEMRTISPKIQKMMDEESHEYWINYTTGLTKLFGMFSLAEKMGSIGTTTVGLMMGNDSYKSDLAHTIALSSDERKAKKKKKKQLAEPIDNNVDINR